MKHRVLPALPKALLHGSVAVLPEGCHLLYVLCAFCFGAGFDWTPELTNAEVEEDIRVETDTLRGER